MSKKAMWVVLALVFLEWLDFSLYLYLAKSIFAKQFFPPSSYSLVLSFALFAAAFVARPLGGWIFGQSADRYGRRNPLIVSAALMGVSTVGIALLPEYGQIGIYATWGLLLLRIGQGLALGGELNNSAMFLIEHHAHRPLATGSLIATSGAAGMFLGGSAAALLQTLPSAGLWRLVFLVLGFTSLLVCRLRKKLHESPEFTPNHAPIRQILREQWPGIINIALLAAFVSTTVYLCNAYWVSYATDQGFWSPITCAWAGSISQLCSALLAIPIARYNPPEKVLKLLRSSLIMAGVGAPILFFFTAQHIIPGVLLGLGFYILANALICSSLFYFLYLQLPAQYRCRGVSTVWALAATLGAALLPLAEQANVHHMPWFAPLCITVIALINGLFLARLKRSNMPSPKLLH